MTQPSLALVNKRHTPRSVPDTTIWPLHPSLQNVGIWMWPQNPSQHNDPGSNSQSPRVRIRNETYLLWSLFWLKALISQTQKLSLQRKKWFVQGHTARLWESEDSWVPTNLPHFTSVGRRHKWDKTLQEHGENSKFHHDHEKSACTSSGTRQGSSYHPTKKTWGFWGHRKQHAKSWVKGGGGNCIWQWRSF